MARPKRLGSVCATMPELGTTVGKTERGILSKASSSSSQARVCKLNRSVREALLGSVTCVWPLVRFQTSQLSTVPKASSPRSARVRAPGMLSSSQASLVPEK